MSKKDIKVTIIIFSYDENVQVPQNKKNKINPSEDSLSVCI